MDASAGGASESRSTAEVSARANRAAGARPGRRRPVGAAGQGSHTAHRVTERLVVVVGHGPFTVRSPSGV